MSVLPEELLHHLTCSNCNFYLSVGPIKIDSNGNNVCGRCLSKNKENNDKFRNAIGLEKFLEKVLFPCSYDKNGCQRMFTWNNIENHENECLRRNYKCPVLTRNYCSWNGTIEKILEHFANIHVELITGLLLTFELSSDTEKNELLEWHNNVFLIQTRMVIGSKKLWIIIRFLGPAELAGNYTYTLAFKKCIHEDNSITISGPTTRNDLTMILTKEEAFIIDMESISRLLNGKGEIYCLINFTCKDEKAIALPPPNDCLAKCSWVGCNYISIYEKIKDHEKHCDERDTNDYKCFCCETTNQWKGKQQALVNHIKENHSDKLKTTSEIKEIQKKGDYYWYIMTHGELFRCALSYTDILLTIRVCYIGQKSRTNKYRFEIELYNKENAAENSLRMHGVCDSYWKSGQNKTLIDLNKFQPYICKETIHYKLAIYVGQ